MEPMLLMPEGKDYLWGMPQMKRLRTTNKGVTHI